jgi:hypothetical protein
MNVVCRRNRKHKPWDPHAFEVSFARKIADVIDTDLEEVEEEVIAIHLYAILNDQP